MGDDSIIISLEPLALFAGNRCISHHRLHLIGSRKNPVSWGCPLGQKPIMPKSDQKSLASLWHLDEVWCEPERVVGTDAHLA